MTIKINKNYKEVEENEETENILYFFFIQILSHPLPETIKCLTEF